MKLSISNIAWGAEHDTEMYQYLHEVGFAGLEIAPTRIFPEAPYDKLTEAKEWASLLKEKYSLEIPSMQSIWYGRQEKIFGTKEERQILIDYTKKAIDFAEAIGCKNLVFGNPKNRDTDDIQGNYHTAIEFFREIGDYAAEHNTTIAIEANPPIYNTRFINRTEQAVELAYKCGSKGVKVNVDLGTIIYNEEDINYLRQIPEFINHVHISEPGLVSINPRDLHKSILSILREVSYNGYVSIEMKSNTTEIIKKVILYIDRLCNYE
jgi:sugar phosphate isomerase/epimerase